MILAEIITRSFFLPTKLAVGLVVATAVFIIFGIAVCCYFVSRKK